MKKMTFNVSAVNEGLAVKAKTGNHEIILDEGTHVGGLDSGPNPMQNLLASLAACENVVAHMAAKEMTFDLQGLTFNVSGSFDPRGFMGDLSVRPYFEEITVDVIVKTNESDARIKELQDIVEARCPVHTMMKAADVKMIDSWVKA